MPIESLLPNSIEEQIALFKPLLNSMKRANSPSTKIQLLNEQPLLKEFLDESVFCRTFLSHVSGNQEIAFKSFLALGQGPVLFQNIEKLENPQAAMKDLLSILEDIEKYYQTIGGVVGYHVTILKFLSQSSADEQCHLRYYYPEGTDISKQTDEVNHAIRWGIESMPFTAEIYPVGGAGDRLMLVDEKTGEPLPAAQLQFGGRSLLEGLIRDLEGREHLYYKLEGKLLKTPIAMMTSPEKNNDYRVKEICNKRHWFNRPKDSFSFFEQPLVPVITTEGLWSSSGPLKLNLKPGGHGVMWKLAHEAKIFEKLGNAGYSKALVRQINNPIAGIDYGLLAFSGIGYKNNKFFGFASCPRLIQAPEGMNVVVEKEGKGGYEYALTNVEYTDFEKRQIKDVPKEPGSVYSAYPSNTNILFVDLEAVEKVALQSSVPGLLINMKTKFPSLDREGNLKELIAGRLESTMQNIADYITDATTKPLKPGKFGQLKTYITFNERRKTISVTKAIYQQGKCILGTPEGCLYEMQFNSEELLKECCGMKIPSLASMEEFMAKGPAFLFNYHPALGPLFSVIGQKIKGGSLAYHSEVNLEIAELEMNQVNVHGSLLIHAQTVIGDDTAVGKCVLRNVTVNNKGINYAASNVFWKNQIHRDEEMRISILGNGEFIAEDVIFEGNIFIEVPDGHQVRAHMDEKGKVRLESNKIQNPTWSWNYQYGDKDQIILNKKIK